MPRCEWCGAEREGMAMHATETRRGWLIDPFHKREPKFAACSDECRRRAETYYEGYWRTLRPRIVAFGLIFTSAFAAGIIFGFFYARWVVPAAIGIGGIGMICYPYTNGFRRDKDGSLKVSLKRSWGEGRINGILLVCLSIFLAFFDLILQSFFFAKFPSQMPLP